MPLRFPRSPFYGGRIIDGYSLDPIPIEGFQPNDPTSVRFRFIAQILLRGVQRCVAAVDMQTLKGYRDRLQEIDEELEEATSFNDPARHEKLSDER